MTQDQDNEHRGLLDRALSRRRMLQFTAGAGAAAFVAATSGSIGSAAGLRSAAAARGQGVRQQSPSEPAPSAPSVAPSPEGTPVTGTFKMASWIGYIDVDASGVSHPSLDRFAQETGITVDYQESVNDNEEFFSSQLQGPLSTGVPTGWDLVVLTDWMIIRLINLGWLESIPAMANFPTNLGDLYRTRAWDPQNTYAAPWQSGMTGLGYDKNQVGDQSDLSAVFTDQFAGKMTYLTEMRDTIGLAALFQGNDPSKLTQDQFDQANGLIKQAVDSSWVRQLTGNDYIEGLKSGDVSIAIAWSGDIATLLVPEQDPSQDFQWTLANQGGMLWTDNMAIPKGAENKAQALVFVNWYYLPANAAEIEAWVNYVCPVKGSADAIKEIDESLATNPLIFPTPDMAAKLYQFVALDIPTAQQWESDFNDAIGL
jgi:spermidine/putrescine transport system substrate-binding protein